jgi:hypothetical protein
MNKVFPKARLLAVEPIATSLMDEVWTLEDIGTYTKHGVRVLYPVVNSPGFPSPMTNQRRNRRWLASAVRAYFASPQMYVDAGQVRGLQNVQYEPKTINTKRKREAA